MKSGFHRNPEGSLHNVVKPMGKNQVRQWYQMNLSPKEKGESKGVCRGRINQKRRRISSKESKKVTYVSFQHFSAGRELRRQKIAISCRSAARRI